jgi:MoaA/NifB/PqqE/SkfB family radical SAM enzyme
MLEIVSKIPSYYLFRATGRPRKLPFNLTLSVSYKCNSRCKTCNIHARRATELSLEEWKTVFAKLGRNLFWTTISGGEPFLREDLPELVQSLYDQCRPSIINIPTNGLLVNGIGNVVQKIATHCSNAQIVVNVSIDEIGDKHDFIRGIPGSYQKAVATFKTLKKLPVTNLSVGIHTVISRYNVERIPEIYEELRSLNADSYITEIAEEREELCTIGSKITPSTEAYSRATDYLIDRLRREHFSKVGRIARAFRVEYYRMVKKVLEEHRQIIPCYAGFASAQIAPDGDVWMCCVKAESMGNLRDFNYDLKNIWFSERANSTRRSIRNRECYCPLANASYTNMLHNVRALLRAGWNFVRMN